MKAKAADPSTVVTLPDSEELRWATDELNLAEFPLGFLSDRAPPGVRTRILEDKKWDAAAKKHFKRRLIVTAADAFGLPTQGDNEILMALFRIAELYNQFQDPKVHFRIHQVIRLLGWDNHGRSYQRVRLGMDRLATVGIKSERAWWDREAQEHKTRTFSILDSWEDFERKAIRSGAVLKESSVFVWGDMIFRSLKSRYTKSIDMEIFRSLRSAIAKQIFRLVDKRFRCYGPRWEFDLREFAIQKLGLSGNYKFESEIQKKLAAALCELEGLAVIATETRYAPIARGRHRIVFTAGSRYHSSELRAVTGKPQSDDHPQGEGDTERLTRELTKRGVSRKRAEAILRKKQRDTRDWATLVGWAIEDHDNRVVDGKVNPKTAPGRLANTIEMADAPPDGFVPRKEAALAAARAKDIENAKTDALEEGRRAGEKELAHENRVVQSYLDDLSPEERAARIDDAWRLATPEEKRYRGSTTRAARSIEAHLLRRLILPRLRSLPSILSEGGAAARNLLLLGRS